MAFNGSCLCGDIQYLIERRFLNAMHCYCRMCRKAHGTVFSTHLIVKPDQLRWIKGRPVPYESSPDAFREFCSRCGTHMLVHGQSGDGTLAIPAGTLDDDPELTILGHMFTADLVGWHQISDTLPQHREWPPGFGSIGS